jgi:Uma2 family endonuclease
MPVPILTPDEFLDTERRATERHEYFRGEVYAMSGGSARHSVISLNLASTLLQRLRGAPCRPYTDLQIWAQSVEFLAYPDVFAVCGDLQYFPRRTDVVTNPVFIAEVLSPSTEAYDRNRKFLLYQSIPTLREYMLVSQTERRVKRYNLIDGIWVPAELVDPGPVRLLSLDVSLSLDEIYDGVSWSGPV